MISERALRLTHDEWERKVEEQANDLVKVNEELHGEIAERVRVEDALREISARLAEAHRRAKMTYWEWSKETDETTYRRDAYAGIRGVPFEDASYSYEETYVYIHPDDRDRVKACYERADADGASFEIDYRIHHVDGSLIYVREIGKAVYNEAGEFTGHTGTQQDVTDLRERDEALRKAHDELEQHVEERTCELSAVNVQLRDEIRERKRAEEVLCESERGLANAQRIAQMGNWEWNIEANYVHWSDELYRIYEIDPEAFGGTPKDFFALVHPDDQENFLDWNDAELSQDRTYFREFRIVVPDGRTKTIQTHAEITYDGNGKAIRVLGTDQDITERRRMEQALRASGLRYQHLFDNAPIAILEEDWSRIKQLIDGLRAEGVTDLRRYFEETPDALTALPDQIVCLDFNQATVDLYRAESKDALWYEINTLSATMSWQGFGAVLAELADGKPFVFHESVDKTMDGADIWVNERIYIPEHARGDWSRVVLTIEDITQRKRADEALRESELRFRTLVEHAPEAITMLDVDTGLYLDANPMAEALHGLPRDELVGKFGPADLSPEIQPDGRPSSEAAPEYLSRALAGEFPKFEWMHLAPDGQETLCEVSLARLPDPHRNLVRASISDITERKRAEQALRESERKYRQASQIANLGYWIWDELEDKCIYCSEEHAKIYGVSVDEYLRRSSSLEIDLEWIHPDDRDQYEKVIRQAVEDRTGYEIIARIIREDGEVRWLHELTEAVLDDHGCMIQTVGILLDITEQKLAEEHLRQAQKMEAIGQLTGGIAHDFNNLLAIMLGNTELLRDLVGEDEEAKAFIKVVIETVGRGSSLTSRLLAFSRQTTLSPAAADVSELIGSLGDMLQRTLGETVELRVQVTADLWPATIDSHQFENALVNLALNARDAMPRGGTLTIETANVTLDEAYAEQNEEVIPGDYVEVSVSDTGNGIPPEELEKVFEPFFTTKDVGEGSGLGLSMVYGFAKQSKGHITIYSEVGHGTSVKLYMPRSEEDVAKEAAKDDSREIARGSERILLVEDDENLREIAARTLRKQGYEVVEAGDGKEAIEHLKDKHPFDLLFTDVVLPGGMNGVEIAEEAKRLQPGIKVLYTTGYAENAVVHGGKLDPGITLVNKPYRREELLEKVRAILDSGDA